MTNTMTTINLHLNNNTQQQALSVLTNLGITLDDAVNLMLLKIAHEKRLPFAENVALEQPMTVEHDEVLQTDAFSLKGMIKTDISLSIDEMNQAIEIEACSE